MQKPFIFPFNKIAFGVEIKMTPTNYLLAVISSSVSPHFLQLVAVSQMSNVEPAVEQLPQSTPGSLSFECQSVLFRLATGTFGNSNVLDS